MSIPLIGILGCGGAVGHIACEILRKEYRIRGGQRRQPHNLILNDDIQWMSVDLYDYQSLYKFCCDCDVILNCAGPSCRIKDYVAIMSAKVGAYYIDVFGANFVESALIKKNLDKKGIYILSAGSVPGLSGILPRWLALQGFEKVEEMHGFSGGRELCSPAGCADMLLSSISGFGITDAFLKNGSIIHSETKIDDKLFLPGFKEDVYMRRFLSSEIERLARSLKISEVHWYNVVVDELFRNVISKACTYLTMDNREVILQNMVEEVSTVASLSIGNMKPWNTMMIELQGTNKKEKVRKRALLQTSNSYHISAVVASMAVETALRQKLSNGIYWACDILEPKTTIKKLLSTKAIESFSVLDIPPVEDNMFSTEIEEGVL
ncbi:hypothetical protein ACOAKC_00640 [Hathewaya histolytica]|uniref:hypothetical protein n=1 Tax=Hathewaya histolytica TaxID=1498 RepID=UPI003B677BF3